MRLRALLERAARHRPPLARSPARSTRIAHRRWPPCAPSALALRARLHASPSAAGSTTPPTSVYAACAREVLDFVRPRRWPFGSNEAAPADRDFLHQPARRAAGRAARRLARARRRPRSSARSPSPAPSSPTRDFDAELSLLDEQVYGRFRAFARGYLRGGRVDDFFTRVLPKLELTERAIRRALERDAPWSDDIAEAELRAPLRAWAERFYAALLPRLQRRAPAPSCERLEIEERVLAPVERLAIALDSRSNGAP